MNVYFQIQSIQFVEVAHTAHARTKIRANLRAMRQGVHIKSFFRKTHANPRRSRRSGEMQILLSDTEKSTLSQKSHNTDTRIGPGDMPPLLKDLTKSECIDGAY